MWYLLVLAISYWGYKLYKQYYEIEFTVDGKEYVRFNMKQIGEVVKLLGDEGELIISAENNNEMFVEIKDSVIVVCPLGKSDR